ncbi:hypothetical protein ASE14_06435 [Agromyces sp. Root81]|nr:hypothetical protein ASE14_06435 [Agromyces sp. Root81]
MGAREEPRSLAGSPLDHEQRLTDWASGWDACAAWLLPRIEWLEVECDRLYLAAFNPKERAELIQRRLDEHFANEWERFIQTQPEHGQKTREVA